MKNFWNTIKSYVPLVAIAIIAWKLAARDATNQTLLTYVAVVALTTVLIPTALRAFTHIKWTNWDGDSDMVKLAKSIVIGCFTVGISLVASSFFGQHEQTAAMSQFNEEQQAKEDSLKNAQQRLDSIKMLHMLQDTTIIKK